MKSLRFTLLITHLLFFVLFSDKEAKGQGEEIRAGGGQTGLINTLGPGRKTIAWLEFPLITEHVKLLNAEIIDGVGNGIFRLFR